MKTLQSKDGFIDQDCTIEHEGKTFTSGGAFIARRTDTGKFGGIVYAEWRDDKPFTVSNWDGDIRMPAQKGKVWLSNFGDKRRSVWFEWNNVKFYGVWCSIDNNQVVRVKEIN